MAASGKLGDHWAVSFPSRFTAPRWMARPPALCPGPAVALSPPPQAPRHPRHSSAWLPWAVVHHQRSEDMCGVGDGDSHVGQRLRLFMQTVGWGGVCWAPILALLHSPPTPRVPCSPRMAPAAFLATWQPRCRTLRPSASWPYSRRVSSCNASLPLPPFPGQILRHLTHAQPSHRVFPITGIWARAEKTQVS